MTEKPVFYKIPYLYYLYVGKLRHLIFVIYGYVDN